jgi:zinc protease
MKRNVCTLLIVFSVLAFSATAETETHDGFFPYTVHRQTLENGLDVIVIPMPEFKDVLSYNTLVNAGARNEIEKGKSGLAHLFEHILFRHRWQGELNGYDTAMGEMGAFNNAYTWFDITYYHPVTFKQNLRQLAELEADRFIRLDFTEKIFKTEAGAVMGEYRNGAANPGRRMGEVLSGLMYGDHGYGHTTIGFLEDVEDMPNEYQAALAFHDNYYRPNNCVMLVTGDVEPNEIFALVRELYADWKPKDGPALPALPAVNGPKREHVSWDVDVPPRIEVAHRAPERCKPGSVATAVGMMLPELLTSETAPLYQKLRSEKQTCSSVNAGSAEYQSFESGPITVSATLFKDKFDATGDAMIDEVAADIVAGLEELKNFSAREDAESTLSALKKKLRYDMLAEFDSPANAAENFYWFYRFDRDLDVFDKLVAALDAVTVADIENFAKDVFVENNRVIVTMSHGNEEAR